MIVTLTGVSAAAGVGAGVPAGVADGAGVAVDSDWVVPAGSAVGAGVFVQAAIIEIIIAVQSKTGKNRFVIYCTP